MRLQIFVSEIEEKINEEKAAEEQKARENETEEEATERQLVEAADLIAASVKDEDDGSSRYLNS